MDIKITFDITERLENAIKAAGNLLAIVPSIEQHESAGGMKVELCKAELAETPKSSEAPEPQTPAPEQPKAEKPKKSAAKKSEPKPEPAQQPAAPAPQPVEPAAAVEFSTKSVEQKPAEPSEPEPPAPVEDEEQNEAEAGKGQSGQIIADLTAKLVCRIQDENRDRATLNKNLRATCEKLGLQFPTIPALIQAIGYGNAYAACIGEG